ncbi:fumarylacetoacetate hydrolase family protein [bacterium]|nr:fumarylacetoacetate hydrolase family protein [bacterium]
MEPGFSWELPIARPANIICLGRNYEGHIRELSDRRPEEPLFFAKSPAALAAHKQDIVIPAWLDTRVDHEAELAVVIGRTAKQVSEETAMEHVAGYTIVNDVTARTMQQEDIAAGNPWYRSKSLDTFCPMGPYIVPADTVNDPGNLAITLTVNGETRQQARTSELIFSIPKIISYISAYLTLQPGDIISTGTPEGISEISDGDLIEISIQGLGTLTNRVRKER